MNMGLTDHAMRYISRRALRQNDIDKSLRSRIIHRGP